MPVNFRDVQFKQDKRFGEKIDRTKVIKAVIVDSLGNDSGSGDIWADRLSRRVWVRELGTAGSSQVICYNIEPVIGLGVILGYEIGSNTREVLRTDKEFFGPTNPTGTSYESPSLTDFLPGGRFALWVASKMISPLSTYPSSTGLSVNVVAGDYPYAGTRKTFAGQTSIALTQNPNAGQHYYAGLYLDSANTLQVVYGASVVLATTPPEPSWPAGAFRLSVVRVNDTQTSITMALDTDTTNDIFDRRMPWSDEATHNLLSATHPDTLTGSVVAGDIVYGNSTPKWARLPKGSDGQVLTLASGLPSWAVAASGGWPFAHVLTVSTTDPDAQYATLAAANAAAAPGDVILLDAETYTLTATETLADAGLTIMGRGPQATIITNSVASGAALYANAANITLRNLTIRHTGAGISAGGVFVDASGLTLDNVIIEKTSGVPTVGYGLWLFDGTGHRLTNGTKLTCTTGTSAYGIRNTNATVTATVDGGEIGGTTQDVFGDQAGSVLTVIDPYLINGSSSWAGGVAGQYHGAVLVKNTSGATALGKDAGYIDSAGEYKTTTTANLAASWGVVVLSGGNNLDCFVARRGRWRVTYTGTAPSAGHYLTTSTVAGSALRSTTMRPEIFAVCTAAGAGGVVEALLYTETTFVATNNADFVILLTSHDSTDFVAQINGAGSGGLTATNVPYDTITAGNANSFKPGNFVTRDLALPMLYNSTRGTYRIITAVNTASAFITTVSTADAWADNDAITIRSQVCNSGGTPFFIDYDFSQFASFPPLTRFLQAGMAKADSSATPGQLIVTHEYSAFVSAKQIIQFNQSAILVYRTHALPIISGRFCMRAGASGSGTAGSRLVLEGWHIASP